MIRRIAVYASYACQLASLVFSLPFRRVVLIGSPLHGNLGDHAIAIAERQFFRKNKLPCAEISGALYRRIPRIIKKCVKPSDIICVTGGGFLGSLWKIEDDMVNDILSAFPKNKIVIFPQTVFFDENEKDAVLNFARTYSRADNLYLCCREKNSFDFATRLLEGTNCKVLLFPDMVLYLSTQKTKPGKQPGFVYLCLRDDKEAVVPSGAQNYFGNMLSEAGYACKNITTNAPRLILFSQRKREVRKILRTLKSARLVITDRLHGMILSAISGTPCIALDNLSGKVRGVYDLWLKDRLPYVRFVKSSDEITSDIVREMAAMGHQNYNPDIFSEHWEQIAQAIKE